MIRRAVRARAPPRPGGVTPVGLRPPSVTPLGPTPNFTLFLDRHTLSRVYTLIL